MATLSFWVSGTPAPKGSFRVVTRGRGGKPLPFPKVLKDSQKTYDWESTVAAACSVAMMGRGRPLDCPLEVSLTFVRPRLSTHFKKDGGLRKSAPPWPAVSPDIDKLARATLDAMEGIAYVNDSRVVKLVAQKVYSMRGPGWSASLQGGDNGCNIEVSRCL